MLPKPLINLPLEDLYEFLVTAITDLLSAIKDNIDSVAIQAKMERCQLILDAIAIGKKVEKISNERPGSGL
jgi:hypothetical protein